MHLHSRPIYFGLIFAAVALTARAATADFPNVGALTYHWQVSQTNPGLVEIYADAVSQPDWQGNYRDLRLQISQGNDHSFPGNYTSGVKVGEYTTMQAGIQFWVRAVWYQTDVSPNVYGPNGTDTPPPQYAVKFEIPANNTDHPITYSTSNGGSFTQQPGAGPTTYTVGGLPSNAPITLTEKTGGVSVGAGGVWESSPSGEYTRTVGTATPVQTNGPSPQTPSTTPTIAPSAPTPSGDAPAPATVKGDVSLKPVWTPKGDVSTGTAPGQSTSDFTTQAYREGVDKQVEAQRQESAKIVAAINSASSSEGSKLDALNSALSTNNTKTDTTNEKLESIKTNTLATANGIGSANSKLDTIATNTSGLSNFVNLFGSDKTAFDVNAKVEEGHTKGQTAATTYSAPKPSGSSPAVTGGGSLPSKLGSWDVTPGHTVTLSLAASGSIWESADSLLHDCRTLILWALVIWFIWETSKILNVYVAALPQVGQAESNNGIENLVPGVAQGKTWGAAAIIVGVFLGMAAAVVAIVDTWATSKGLGIGALFESIDLSAVGGAFALLDRYLPLIAIAQFAVMRAGLSYLVGPLYLVAASVVKFTKA